MAVLLKTSRAQVDRILDPNSDITLSSLQRAAALVGQRVVIELGSVRVENPSPSGAWAGSPRELGNHGLGR